MAEDSFPRNEYDPHHDIFRSFYSDKPIASTREHTRHGVRHVAHFADDGSMVGAEIHGWTSYRKGMEDMTDAYYQADQGLTGEIGEIAWEVTECAAGAVLQRGHRRFRLEEVAMRLLSNADSLLCTARVPLRDPFTFGLSAELLTEDKFSGFALVSDRTDMRTFCWEWFNPESPTRAVKIQEEGVLQVAWSHRGNHWQLSRTEFLTDVSLRVSKFDTAITERDWRVLIKKGSYMDWPALIDGKIV